MLWSLNHTLTEESLPARRRELITAVLSDRHLTTQSAIETFLHPPDPLSLEPAAANLNPKALEKIIQRLFKAITRGERLIIYGDYDADGITATAILWETLHALGAKAVPFIPARDRHGYGLSLKGLKEALIEPASLVITVDNGVTAYAAAEFLKDQSIDLIITDHHQLGKTLPPHYALLHSDQISGSGVAWFLAKELIRLSPTLPGGDEKLSTLDLVTIGTVADMLPLTGVNRSLASHGLIALRQSTRPGLKALLTQAGVAPDAPLTTYHINYIIAPRLNAMGRLEHALDSLRLLCTHDPTRAEQLASLLDQTNVSRQDLTQTLVDQALELVGAGTEPILVVAHPDFHEGVIGLVAGKLAETFYRPAIVISQGKLVSKASARSIKGVNIIELIRTHQSLLLNAGGHPMAAGFSLESAKLEVFKQAIIQTAQTIDLKLFTPRLNIDALVALRDINQALYQDIQTLKPFGIGNPEPVLALKDIRINTVNLVGKTQNHLKLTLTLPSGQPLTAIGFGMGNLPGGDEKRERLVSPGVNNSPGVNISPGDLVDLAFTLSENTFRGTTSLQLLLKDFIRHPGPRAGIHASNV